MQHKEYRSYKLFSIMSGFRHTWNQNWPIETKSRFNVFVYSLQRFSHVTFMRDSAECKYKANYPIWSD